LDTRSQAPQPATENVKTQALNWVLVILSICIIAHSILLKLSNGTKYSLKSHTYYVLEGVEGMNIHT
jgi:hypothetical protein